MSTKASMLLTKIESIEAEIQRVEVKFPLYARQLRTKLVRFRIQYETELQRIAASAEPPHSSDNFADGGRRKNK